MKAKNRFWRMLRIVACDRRRARTMPVRSPFSSVTPALSIATSVPVPMAMPTSAAASAGASLTPSPAMHDPACRLVALHDGALLVRQDLGLHLVDAEPARDRSGGGPVVAGEHDNADALRLEAGECLGRRGLYRIGDGDGAGQLPIRGHENGGGAVGAQPVRLLGEGEHVDTVLTQEGGVAEHHLAALDGPECAFAGRRVELRYRRGADPLLLRRGDDGYRERVLAGALDAGREPQDLGLRKAGRGNDRDHGGSALGQGAGLVDDKGVDLLHVLEGLGVLDEDAG